MTQESRKQFIVVVDGDPDVCRTIQRCAWSHGIHADAFTSARDFIGAIESMPAFVPDCVVLDMQLSQLEGFDVLERLGRSRPNTPVIYLTGTIDPGLPQVVPRSESRGVFGEPRVPHLFFIYLIVIV
jgi:FixJ family two-component response regulator